MLNEGEGRKAMVAVCITGEKTLHCWTAPTEESESGESSADSLGMSSEMTLWGLCLGGGASWMSILVGVWGRVPGADALGAGRPTLLSARSITSGTC